jgi:hypothetical protein
MEGAFATVRDKTQAKAFRIAPTVSQDIEKGTVTATFPWLWHGPVRVTRVLLGSCVTQSNSRSMGQSLP